MKRLTSACGMIVLVAGMSVGACAPQPGANTVSRDQVGQAETVQYGTLTSMRVVDIRPGQTTVGTVVGATLGGIGGSRVGRSTAANVAGAVAGGAAGAAAGSAVQGSQSTAGLELAVRLDSGESIAIIQPGDPRDFRVDDRVRVIGTAENARVTR